MPLAQRQDVVQALSAQASHDAFSDGVRIRRPHWSPDDLQAFGPKDGIEGSREVAVAIVDQKTRSDLGFLELPGQVPRLLGGPGSTRVRAAGSEQDAPAGQLQEEQDVEALQEDGIHREVVTGQDRLAESLEEATPGEPWSPRCGWDAVAAEQVANAGRGDPMAELEQLASDTLVTPERVLLGQLEHQPLALCGKLRSAGTASAAECCPATMDQRPVPAVNRGWLHQEQGPSRQLPAEGSQDQAISGPPARSSSCASEDEQLLPEDKEFEVAIGSRAAAKDEEVNQEAKEGIEHCEQHGQAE